MAGVQNTAFEIDESNVSEKNSKFLKYSYHHHCKNK